jgi:hypothetical protein
LRILDNRLAAFEEVEQEKLSATVETTKPIRNWPSKLDELRVIHRVLVNEIVEHVNIRKALAEPIRAEKMRKRKKMRIANEVATDIQRVFRGFLARRLVKKMKRAGLTLTSIMRGFLVRVRWKKRARVFV